MTFICMQVKLQDFLDCDREKFLCESEWFLYDRNIRTKSLASQGKSEGNLRCYMDRIMYYPAMYKEPLYCYLISDSYTRALKLLPEKYSCIWNMKRIPQHAGVVEKYQRIPKEKMIFGNGNYDECSNYLNKKFHELVDFNFRDGQVSEVIISDTE